MSKQDNTIPNEEQDIVEKAAKAYAKTITNLPQWNEHDASIFIAGVNWQKQRSYSENEVNHLEFIYNRMKDIHNENENYDYMIKFNNIIKQLKKIK